MNDFYQINEIIFGENNNYHQIGKAYLQYELTIEKGVAFAANRFLVNRDSIRLINNAFADSFHEARLSTTGTKDIKHKKYVGQFSTNMRALTNKDEGFFYLFKKIDESEAANEKHHYVIILLITMTYLQRKVKLEDNYHLNKLLDFAEHLTKKLKTIRISSNFQNNRYTRLYLCIKR